MRASTLSEPTWDYTEHAAYYSARPNYAEGAIDRLVRLVTARTGDGFLVADVGAGTGNLTVMLLQRGLRCVAVEPNEEMRKYGTARTQSWGVRWLTGTGEETGLPARAVDWVTMGSSFNTMHRPRALRESHRILKPGGHFTCLWNHRDLDDPIQRHCEALIRHFLPGYTHGTRRENQSEIIERSQLFDDCTYLEVSQVVTQTAADYVAAWRSTRNLSRQAGDRFARIISAIEAEVAKYPRLDITYTTRAWTVRKRGE